MELYRKVRLACADGMSKRAAARHFNISRDSVDKILAFSTPPGYLIRQPILLSSVIVQKGDLRFRNIRAEDFIFNHDAMKRAEIVIHHPEVRVIYDQTRTARKTMRFRVRRTYRIMQILTGSHLAAAFLTLRFIATFAWRKAALRLRPASNGDIG